MPTIRVVDDNVIEFVDSNGDVAAREEYDEAASEVSFVDGDGNPMPVSLGDATAESVSTVEASIAQTAVRLRSTSTQTVPTDTLTQMEFGGEVFADTAVFDVDLPNDQVTVLKGGKYTVSGKVQWDDNVDWADGDELITRIEINGSFNDRTKSYKSTTGLVEESCETIVSLSAGDTVTVSVEQTSGNDQFIGANPPSRLAIGRLG